MAKLVAALKNHLPRHPTRSTCLMSVGRGEVLIAVAVEISYRDLRGLVPTPKLVAALKLPAPLPNKIDTV